MGVSGHITNPGIPEGGGTVDVWRGRGVRAIPPHGLCCGGAGVRNGFWRLPTLTPPPSPRDLQANSGNAALLHSLSHRRSAAATNSSGVRAEGVARGRPDGTGDAGAVWAGIKPARMIKRLPMYQDQAARRAKPGQNPMQRAPSGTCPGGGTARSGGVAAGLGRSRLSPSASRSGEGRGPKSVDSMPCDVCHRALIPAAARWCVRPGRAGWGSGRGLLRRLSGEMGLQATGDRGSRDNPAKASCGACHRALVPVVPRCGRIPPPIPSLKGRRKKKTMRRRAPDAVPRRAVNLATLRADRRVVETFTKALPFPCFNPA